MPLTDATATEYAFLRISGNRPESEVGIDRAAIKSMIPAALGRFTARVYSGKIRGKLEKTYTRPMVNGEVDLSHADFNDLLVESLRTAYITVPDPDDASAVIEVQFYEHPRDLDLPKAEGWYYSSLVGNNLRIRTHVPDIPTDADVTIIATFEPTTATVPPDLEQSFIDVLVEVATEIQLVPEVQREAEAITQ